MNYYVQYKYLVLPDQEYIYKIIYYVYYIKIYIIYINIFIGGIGGWSAECCEVKAINTKTKD